MVDQANDVIGGAGGARARERVLIVDDEPGIRESLVELFADETDVAAAASVGEALRALQSTPFRLIITDLRLGARADGGFQVMAAAGLLSPDATVIALTAYPDPESRDAALRLGARHFFEKPADLEHLAIAAAAAGVSSALRSVSNPGVFRPWPRTTPRPFLL